jgi:SAM-dependent methyltransferase
MTIPTPDVLQASYDRVARHYANEFYQELQRKPFDCECLNQFAARVAPGGLVCDLGCGPGQVARYLRDLGLTVCGVDLSPQMVLLASMLNPDIHFEQGNMMALTLPPKSFAGIASFYALIHLPRQRVVRVLEDLWHVLQPDGWLLLAFHGGTETIHTEEWFGEPVDVGVTLFEGFEMAGYLTDAGFEVRNVFEREPYPFEYQTRRIYVLAHKTNEQP